MYVGGLDEKVSEPLLWELFLQAGPVVNTHMPKDRVTGQHQGEYQLIFFKIAIVIKLAACQLMEKMKNPNLLVKISFADE